MSSEKKTIIIVNQSTAASAVKDILTFGMFAGLMWFNHQYLNGSAWVDLAFIVLVTMFLVGRSSSRTFTGTKSEAIKWLSNTTPAK